MQQVCDDAAMRKGIVTALATVGIVVAVVVGLSQAGTTNEAPVSAAPTPAEAAEALRGAPAPLAALHAQAGERLDGGPDAFRDRLDDLRGHPVVVNKWASWCGPCRAEFPFFQRLSVELGQDVAFLGLNSGDSVGEAREFLGEFPVSFPHYTDPNEKIAVDIGASSAYPVTVFYDASGEQTFVHQGGYPSEEALREDVERYALGGIP